MIRTNYHCNFCHADFTTQLEKLHGVKLATTSAMNFIKPKDATEHICENCRALMLKAMDRMQTEPVLAVANG